MIKTNSKIILTKIIRRDKKVIYKYKLTGASKQFINKIPFIISFDFNIKNVPDSILVIPFISNLLPLCWTLNFNLFIDEIDEEFYKSLGYIKNAYRDMIKTVDFNGDIVCNKVVPNKKIKSDKKIQMFSGGVDSLCTYVNHNKENLEFFYLWGSDIAYNNNDGYYTVKDFIDGIAKKERIKTNYVKSNFRDIINYDNINKILIPLVGDNYWHCIQHGIALLGHAAIVAYVQKASTIYIPATCNPNFRILCASIPEIDNQFKFTGIKTVHDGFELSRLDKVKNIVNHNKKAKNKLPLRVCWQSLEGINCSMCEKCSRTMLELLACGENPQNYNFRYDDEVKENIQKIVTTSNFGGEFLDAFYIESANELKKQKTKEFDYLIKKYKNILNK